MNNKSAKLALALCLAGTAAPVSADESLPSRAMSALSVAIASQGNAALTQIREDLRRELLKTLEPMLLKPEQQSTRIPATKPAH